MRVRNVLVTIVLVVLSIVIALPVAALSAPLGRAHAVTVYDDDAPEADDPEDDEEMPSATHPVVLRLAQMMGLKPEDILDAMEQYKASFGRIMMAFRLAEYLGETFGLGWEDLLEAHSAGEGWGLFKSAHRWVQRLGDLTIADEVDEVLERRRAGEGWGQIKKAYGTVPAPTVTVPAPTVPAKLLKPQMSPRSGPKKTPPGLAKKSVVKPVKVRGKKK